MKCAQCLVNYITDTANGDQARANAWAKVNAAETVISGTALCRDHLHVRGHPTPVPRPT